MHLIQNRNIGITSQNLFHLSTTSNITLTLSPCLHLPITPTYLPPIGVQSWSAVVYQGTVNKTKRISSIQYYFIYYEKMTTPQKYNNTHLLLLISAPSTPGVRTLAIIHVRHAYSESMCSPYPTPVDITYKYQFILSQMPERSSMCSYEYRGENLYVCSYQCRGDNLCIVINPGEIHCVVLSLQGRESVCCYKCRGKNNYDVLLQRLGDNLIVHVLLQMQENKLCYYKNIIIINLCQC